MVENRNIMRKIIIALLLLCFVHPGKAQVYKNKLDSIINTYRVNRANKFYDNLAYAKAIEKYEKLNVTEHLSDSVKGLLGEAYLKVNQPEQSEQVLSSVPVDHLSNDQLFMYVQALKYNGKYAKADSMMVEYEKRDVDDSRTQELLNSLPSIEKILATERYLIEDVDINSTESDFGPFLLNDELYFSSARDLDYIIKRNYAWKDAPYLNILASKVKENSFSNPKVFSSHMRSMYHDGPVCFSADGQELFITRNKVHTFIASVTNKQKTYNTLNIVYSQKMNDGTWSDPVELPFNNDAYSCAHAFLTEDGKRLYFASDMPGGIGQTDLYYVDRNGTEWGTPVNLGEDINTEDNEMFPFEDAKGKLYFSSNGHLGLGGLDVYVAEYRNGKYTVKNMGYPLNTSQDDFSIFMEKDGEHGYFSSNREGGKGDDDIYRFTVLEEVPFKKPLTVKLIDKNTRQILPNAKVVFQTSGGNLLSDAISNTKGEVTLELEPVAEIIAEANLDEYYPYKETFTLNEENNEILLELEKRPFWGIYGSVLLTPDNTPIPNVTLAIQSQNNELTSVESDENGVFRTLLDEDSSYQLVFTKKGFFTKRVAYSTTGRDTGYVNVNEFMELEMKEARVGESIEIRILYDLGKWNIREDAAEELDDMIQFLKDNPEIKIELGSHTDSRGSASYNQKLSQKRAESAVSYMVERGVDSHRIVAKGYGETRLKNHCADGVSCSEEEHQANRRSEVTIIAM